MKSSIKKLIKTLPYVKQLLVERDRLRMECDRLEIERNQLQQERDRLTVERDKFKANQHYPPGHFYSPLAAIEELKQREHELFGKIPSDIPGVDLNEAEQLALLDQLREYYADLPFPARKQESFRFYYDNEYYSYSDAIFLYSMIRHLQPQKIIEVGSGYSSCVTLDTNELFCDRAISCTFIDPFPQRLYSLIQESDLSQIEVLSQSLQSVPLSRFQALEAGDILFIDSTHVTKTGSDVNYLFFEILPALQNGVYVHFHDIFYPFEYPKQWIYEGRGWNECYLLKAFLQYSSAFKIVLFNTYLEHFHEAWFQQEMPLCLKNRGGSIWLKKG